MGIWGVKEQLFTPCFPSLVFTPCLEAACGQAPLWKKSFHLEITVVSEFFVDVIFG